MTDPAARTGQCLCGAVRFRATPAKQEMLVCHCDMCRRWSGGTWMAVDCGTSVDFERDDALGVYTSSDWGERLFCKSCGTTLIWRDRASGHSGVSAQAFDDPSEFAFTNQIFFDEKPANYAFANATKTMTAAETIEAFSAGGEH